MSAKSCPAQKTAPLAGEDDGAHVRVVAEPAEGVDQLPHVRLGERVAPVGAVHGDGAEAGMRGDEDVLVRHGWRIAPDVT